jgi:hypothetical protein
MGVSTPDAVPLSSFRQCRCTPPGGPDSNPGNEFEWFHLAVSRSPPRFPISSASSRVGAWSSRLEYMPETSGVSWRGGMRSTSRPERRVRRSRSAGDHRQPRRSRRISHRSSHQFSMPFALIRSPSSALVTSLLSTSRSGKSADSRPSTAACPEQPQSPPRNL